MLKKRGRLTIKNNSRIGMCKKKIIILLPDGVGLRSIAYSNFIGIGNKLDYKIIFWNQTSFPIAQKLGHQEIALSNNQLYPLTDIFKRARKIIELQQFYKKAKDPVYISYLFESSRKGWKNRIKNSLVSGLVILFKSKRGLNILRKGIKYLERRTDSYQRVCKLLQEQKPDFILCTNQRASQAIAPLLAAQDAGIPIASFIFSWDNLPKATMVLEPDYYFVWSDFMKKELQYYYPYIEENQIRVVGTPQFENHLDRNLILTKEAFFNKYQLDLNKKYICFSGDDVTTSPYDQLYLRDVAAAVRLLNSQGHNFGVVFRRSPADFTNRYDNVLEDYKEEIVSINPMWQSFGVQWNQKMPLPEDRDLLINTIQHTELVINVGSSMVFDFVIKNKACIFINYNPVEADLNAWNINNIYQYIHFRSMPSKEAVLWCNSSSELKELIKKVVDQKASNIFDGKKWFEKINLTPIENASNRIWDEINRILNEI